MFVFGIIGYLMRKLDFPAAPVVLGLCPGPAGGEVFQTIADHVVNSLAIFFTRPIAPC